VTAKVIRHVVFRGRVQGVGFRDFVLEEAMQQGLEGWVRNRADHVSVEAVFAGSSDVVATVIEVCRMGPPAARVDALDQRNGTTQDLALGQPGSFVRLPTV
jgi:acylphosphatase